MRLCVLAFNSLLLELDMSHAVRPCNVVWDRIPDIPPPASGSPAASIDAADPVDRLATRLQTWFHESPPMFASLCRSRN